MKNCLKMEISAVSRNEGFARSAVAAFAASLNPTLAQLSDIKTAVSEAVTNCIVHAYKNAQRAEDKILLECTVSDGTENFGDGAQAELAYACAQKKVCLNGREEGWLHITVTDFGCGIENVSKALTPFYTTLQGEERSGMGFTIMQTFMSDFSVKSERGKGTVVKMSKRFASPLEEFNALTAEAEGSERLRG